MKRITWLVAAGIVALLALEAWSRSAGAEDSRLDRVFADAVNAHRGLRGRAIRAQATIDSLNGVVGRERDRRRLATSQSDSAAKLVRLADSALAEARLAGDSGAVILAQDGVIRTLRDETGALRRALTAAEVEIGSLNAISHEWEALAGERLVTADSLFGALMQVNKARVCRILNVGFLPRCPSRVVSAFVGGGLALVGKLVLDSAK